MFGFVRQSTYDAAIDAIAARDAEIRELREVNYALDRTAAKYRQERNDARASLKVFTDRRDRAKLNLKQFRGSGSVTSTNGGESLNA